MENVLFTQLSVSEIEAIVTKAVEASFVKHRVKESRHEEEESEILNGEEAMKLLQVAKQTIYGYTHKGIVPHIKKGKKLLFVKADLMRWLKEGKKATVAELTKRDNSFTLNTKKKSK